LSLLFSHLARTPLPLAVSLFLRTVLVLTLLFMDSCDSLCDSVGSARLLGHPPDLRKGRRGAKPLASKDAVLVSIMGGQRDNLVGPQLGNVTGKVGRQRNLIQWNTHIEAHR
jgi:hypothetical protein